MEALKYPLQVLDKKIYKLDNYNAGYDKAMQDIIKSLKWTTLTTQSNLIKH